MPSVELKRIDVGCSGLKKPGFIGIDINPTDGVDIVCDIANERWPLDDNSVGEVYSSHCFEHIKTDRIVHVFAEMTRVCADGAKMEIWHPHAMHRDAFLLGHVTPLSEELYYHLCTFYDPWATVLGGRWLLDEVRYHVDPKTIAEVRRIGGLPPRKEVRIES